MIAAVAVAAVALAALALVAWAVHAALAAGERAASAQVAGEEAAGESRRWQAVADTESRLRRAATARAATLEQELADADVASIADHPDPGARRRVLARWRDAEVALSPGGAGGGGEPGAVPDPGAPGPATDPGVDP